jgi:hypothetical protein
VRQHPAGTGLKHKVSRMLAHQTVKGEHTMKIRLLATWFTLCCALFLGTPVRANKAELPNNLLPSPDLIPTLEKLWQRSPTFRQQCQRIAATPTLTVRIGVGIRPAWFYDTHAVTKLERYADGTMTATVYIFDLSHIVEFIGHEFEHLLEQIEGVRLHSLALQHGSGVYRTKQGNYETARAIKAGHKVYAEFRTAKGIEY